jgi:hypothetical protein
MENDDTITTADGRVLKLRKLKALDQVRLLRAIGAEQSSNQPYVRIVEAAASIESVDGIPNPIPRTESQIDAMIGRIGDEGLNAVVVKQMRELNATYEALLAAQEASGAVEGTSGERPLDPSKPSSKMRASAKSAG